MFERILVALDGTDASSQAFIVGLAIAKRFGGEIYLCSVIEHPARKSDLLMGAVDDVIDHETKHFEFAQKSLLQRAGREGVKVTSHIMVGRAVEKILRFVEEEHVDAVVIGGLGQSHVLPWYWGGTGMQIATHAPCTVVVAR